MHVNDTSYGHSRESGGLPGGKVFEIDHKDGGKVS